MGYKQRTIRLDFDELGDGCYVIIRNPKIMSTDELDSGVTVELDDQGKPVSDQDAHAAGAAVMTKLVTDWCVWDVNDESDDPAVLPLPSEDESVWDRVPVGILGRIGKEISEALAPR